MSIANVFHTQVLSTSGGGSGSITSTGVNSAGSSIILVSVASFGGVATINDSKSNNWTALPAQLGGSSVTLQMWYCINPITDSSHTFTYPGATGCFPALEAVGWSGVATITPF